jgi:hypothetical protein
VGDTQEPPFPDIPPAALEVVEIVFGLSPRSVRAWDQNSLSSFFGIRKGPGHVRTWSWVRTG